jgi:hypothetical protein
MAVNFRELTFLGEIDDDAHRSDKGTQLRIDLDLEAADRVRCAIGQSFTLFRRAIAPVSG